MAKVSTNTLKNSLEIETLPIPERPRKRQRSLVHQLVDTITQQIQAQTLRPGDKLPTEAQIMQAHGVSRTIVREALSRMQAAGLVETHHGIGTFILEARPSTRFRISPTDIVTATDEMALMEVRISLEIESAGLAAMRRTEVQLVEMRKALDDFAAASMNHVGDTISPDFRFHIAIANATGNRYYADILSTLDATMIPRSSHYPTRLAKEDLTEHLSRVNRQHEDIYEAIARKDTDFARAAMRMHLTSSRDRMHRTPSEIDGSGKPT